LRLGSHLLSRTPNAEGISAEWVFRCRKTARELQRFGRGEETPSSHNRAMDETTINRYRRWLSRVITDISEDIFEVPCQRCGTTQLRNQVNTTKCANKPDCDFARANLHNPVIGGDQPGTPGGTAGSKRPITGAQLGSNGERQNPSNMSIGAAQHLIKQEVDRDEMIVDPLPSRVNERVAGSMTGAPRSVAARGKEAAPATEGHKPATSGAEGFVTHTFSPSTGHFTEGQNTSVGQRLDGNSDNQSHLHQRVQIHKRQRKLTDGFVTKISKHQHGGTQVLPARVPLQALQPRKKGTRKATGCHTWVSSSLREKQCTADPATTGKGVPEACAGCSRQILESNTTLKCTRCRTTKYCNNACRTLHWAQGHRLTCKPCTNWCPACGEDVEAGSTTTSTCERCQEVMYCSPKCLHSDFNNHLHRCPLATSDQTDTREQRPASEVDGSRMQIPTLTQPGGIGPERRILVDNDEEILKIRDARWRLSRSCPQTLEGEDKDATKCEEARDRVIEWCVQHNPRSDIKGSLGKSRNLEVYTEVE
jgi:hypothetical protein